MRSGTWLPRPAWRLCRTVDASAPYRGTHGAHAVACKLLEENTQMSRDEPSWMTRHKTMCASLAPPCAQEMVSFETQSKPEAAAPVIARVRPRCVYDAIVHGYKFQGCNGCCRVYAAAQCHGQVLCICAQIVWCWIGSWPIQASDLLSELFFDPSMFILKSRKPYLCSVICGPRLKFTSNKLVCLVMRNVDCGARVLAWDAWSMHGCAHAILASLVADQASANPERY